MVSELSILIHNMVLDNPMPAKDLARAIGKPYSTLLREVNPYDAGAKLGADTLLGIMAHTGTIAPLEHMVNKMGLRLEPKEGAMPLVRTGSFQSRQDRYAHSMICPVCGYHVAPDTKAGSTAGDVTDFA